jgi:hypothetical protein
VSDIEEGAHGDFDGAILLHTSDGGIAVENEVLQRRFGICHCSLRIGYAGNETLSRSDGVRGGRGFDIDVYSCNAGSSPFNFLRAWISALGSAVRLAEPSVRPR